MLRNYQKKEDETTKNIRASEPRKIHKFLQNLTLKNILAQKDCSTPLKNIMINFIPSSSMTWICQKKEITGGWKVCDIVFLSVDV